MVHSRGLGPLISALFFSIVQKTKYNINVLRIALSIEFIVKRVNESKIELISNKKNL